MFANPPTSFSCYAVDQDNGLSSIILSWQPPTLLVNYKVTGRSPEYEVRINGVSQGSVITELTTTILAYENMGGVCEVFVINPLRVGTDGGIATVTLNTSKNNLL